MITKNELREMIKNVWDVTPLEVEYDGNARYTITVEYVDNDGDDLHCSVYMSLATEGYEDVDDLEESQEYYEMLEKMTDAIYQIILDNDLETFKLS